MATFLKMQNIRQPRNDSHFYTVKCRKLKTIWHLPKVIDLRDLSDEKVVFGATIIIEDIQTGNEVKYQLVGPFESDISQNKISVTSPIGKAMIGKEIGDEVSVKAPGGIRDFQIVDIKIEEEIA